jgi:LysR family transcriptional regulator, nitrogen assimilation regulatory protein
MDLKQLEYFVRVAELGSFTRASILLSVAQPALSKQIRGLELELRQTLFNRNGRGISLTEEGALLLAHARGIVAQVERARQELRESRGSPLGKVVIATPAITGRALMSGFVTEFRQRFPRASLEIIEGKSRIIREWLLMGRIDIGILYDAPVSQHLELTPLRNDDLLLVSLAAKAVAPKTAPVPFRDLAKFPLILPGRSHTIRRLVESSAAKAGIKLNVVLEVEGAAFILELVQLGHGCTMLPDFSLSRASFPRRLQTNEVAAPRIRRALKMAVCLQRPVARVTRETARLLQKHLGPGSPYFSEPEKPRAA